MPGSSALAVAGQLVSPFTPAHVQISELADHAFAAGPRPERAEERRAQRSATDEPREAGKLTLGGVLNFADGLRCARLASRVLSRPAQH